ncbi:MAG TPA: hypothetical protein DD393_01355 [Ruminococcaceae bacterium]|jgi:hypothetical protein|nr:hypothetical protein [Oscillospiraceae bacterium]HBL99293.1 hypothetical protein [Oscillospiraceae bacterium]
MIIRDEEGRPIAAEKVSDVSDELAGIEKKLRADVKKMSDEEKKELINELSELQDIIGLVTPELQKSSNPIELMGFMKQVLKIKNTAEKFKEKNIDND